MEPVIVIPTLDPDERLVRVVDELRVRGMNRFVIVDDGSVDTCDEVFCELEQRGAHVVHHAVNLGKGTALKTGFAAVRRTYPEATHVVTADDDGQHKPDDIMRICEAAAGNHDHVVLGVRDLQGSSVPLRSRIGNAFSSAYFKFDTGMTCPDTQTGLRAIPATMIPFALSIAGERYEYEMNFLTAVAKRQMPLVMVPIATVYENNNAASHFSTVRDSVRIYRQFLRFAGSSLACAAVDLVLFAAFAALFDMQIALVAVFATVLARLMSGALNFTLNRVWSFSEAGSRTEDARRQALRYGILFFAQMCASAALVAALSVLPVPLVGLKVLVDSTLFVVSYFVQRNWVFKSSSRSRALVMKGGMSHEGWKAPSSHLMP